MSVGRGVALGESMPFDRTVVGSNSALAATYGPWSVAPRRIYFETMSNALVWNASERFMPGEAL